MAEATVDAPGTRAAPEGPVLPDAVRSGPPAARPIITPASTAIAKKPAIAIPHNIVFETWVPTLIGCGCGPCGAGAAICTIEPAAVVEPENGSGEMPGGACTIPEIELDPTPEIEAIEPRGGPLAIVGGPGAKPRGAAAKCTGGIDAESATTGAVGIWEIDAAG